MTKFNPTNPEMESPRYHRIAEMLSIDFLVDPESLHRGLDILHGLPQRLKPLVKAYALEHPDERKRIAEYWINQVLTPLEQLKQAANKAQNGQEYWEFDLGTAAARLIAVKDAAFEDS